MKAYASSWAPMSVARKPIGRRFPRRHVIGRVWLNRVWGTTDVHLPPLYMATRRTALPRTVRASSIHHPPPPTAGGSRTRSTVSRPSSAVPRSERTTPIEEPAEAPHPIRSSKSATLNNAHDSSESNIQVVIRCRRRSEREIQENSPIIVSTKGAKGQDITIETAAPVSSLGLITLAPTRTYPFDLVFGPEADQALIYHDVVSPMLDEVLQGYNCTLFAYGQTGTGKT